MVDWEPANINCFTCHENMLKGIPLNTEVRGDIGEEEVCVAQIPDSSC